MRRGGQSTVSEVIKKYPRADGAPLAPKNDAGLSFCHMPKIRRSVFLLETHGLAVLRGWMRGEEVVGPRVRELLKLAEGLSQHPLNVEIDLDEMDVSSGYAAWSETYDGPNNPLISADEPAVRSTVDPLPLGARRMRRVELGGTRSIFISAASTSSASIVPPRCSQGQSKKSLLRDLRWPRFLVCRSATYRSILQCVHSRSTTALI